MSSQPYNHQIDMRAFVLFLLSANHLISGELLNDISKQYEITPSGRILVVPVASKDDLGGRQEMKLTSVELLRFFPEKVRTTSAYENKEETVVAVILPKQLFVYGKDWSDPKGFIFRFLGQWLDEEGKAIGDMSSFRHPNPRLNPAIRLTTQSQAGMKMSRTGGFGFICYDLTEQKPEDARFLKLKVLKERVLQPPAADARFEFVMELPAAE
jgi:hypothetical protein